MRTNIYSIFDIRAETFAVPFFMPRDGMAIRAFSDLANDKRSQVGLHPSDYKLVHLGFYDDESGLVEPCVHKTLGFGNDYIERNVNA